ncbi:MAG: LysM peptidoglycan-binding domain-containing protein [Vulcanimicrobiaceae bacterium]
MVHKRKKLTLMPAITLAALSLAVTLPVLSSTRLHAATPTHYTTVTVQSGDTLWSIAAAHIVPGAGIQATVDRITDANHLTSPSLQPGEELRVPE